MVRTTISITISCPVTIAEKIKEKKISQTDIFLLGAKKIGILPDTYSDRITRFEKNLEELKNGEQS